MIIGKRIKGWLLFSSATHEITQIFFCKKKKCVVEPRGILPYLYAIIIFDNKR